MKYFLPWESTRVVYIYIYIYIFATDLFRFTKTKDYRMVHEL